MQKDVKLKGKAEDAKGGAVLVLDDGRVIYVEGLSSWPDEAFGKMVEASGVLVRKKYLPDPVNEKGEICQGAEGDQDVLQSSKWIVL